MTVAHHSRPIVDSDAPFGNADCLSCRERGATCPVGVAYSCVECFGPLEASYTFTGITKPKVDKALAALHDQPTATTEGHAA